MGLSYHANTFHINAVRVVADQWCEDPKVEEGLSEILLRMKARHYPEYLLDSLVQFSWGDYDIYDAFCYAKLVSMLDEGEIAVAFAEVLGIPGPDRDRERNQKKLDGIAGPFRATFLGGHGDCDGELTWQGEAGFMLTQGKETSPVYLQSDCTIPLEVGTTSASRSLLHLVNSPGLARWPYGYDRCYIFYRVKPSSFDIPHIDDPKYQTPPPDTLTPNPPPHDP